MRILKWTLDALAYAVLIVLCMAVVYYITPGRAWGHDFYTKWMKPHKPTESCCSNTDCEAVQGRKLGDGRYQAFIEGEWVDIPPEIILDPAKPENVSPGGYHACWNRSTGELYCFREEEVKM